jgi:hypothetical protein
MAGVRSEKTRREGNVEQWGTPLRVRYYAGLDPVTAKPM